MCVRVCVISSTRIIMLLLNSLTQPPPGEMTEEILQKVRVCVCDCGCVV